MSTLRERLDGLKKANGVVNDSELLRVIYQYLYKNSKTKETEDEFVRKTKGSFSSMIDEKRDFDERYFYPLEKRLNTSMVYLLEGTGEAMKEQDQRGLRYAAKTDTVGNYERLIKEEVYMEQDEYMSTLLDYMIDFKSRTGFDFFAKRNQLPLNAVCLLSSVPFGLTMNQHIYENLLDAMFEVCRPETLLPYLNGYYFYENGVDLENADEAVREDLELLAFHLRSREDLWSKLIDYKKIPFNVVNPNVRRIDGKPMEDLTFVNVFFTLMLNVWLFDIDTPETGRHITRELFEKAIEINKTAMSQILELGYSSYRVDGYGFVYSNDVLCGSIAMLRGGFETLHTLFTPATIAKSDELISQIQEFKEKVAENKTVSIMDGEMRLAKQDNPAFYDFYRLMKEKEVKHVAQWLGEASGGKDRFRLPAGKQMPLNHNTTPALFNEALEILAAIDERSEESLGEGKAYAFPGLTNRSFFVGNDAVNGIAPTKVAIGGRYDNLAEFLSQTCLSMPTFCSANGIVESVAKAMKAYRIAKQKEAGQVIDSVIAYYRSSTSAIDSNEERGKMLIASALEKALWLELYKKEVLSHYK